MEWKNYLSLEDQNPGLNGKYLLNINEKYNEDYYPYNNQKDDINFFKKDNINEDMNSPLDEAEKIKYYNLMNNIQNSYEEYNKDDNYFYLSPEKGYQKDNIDFLQEDSDYEEEIEIENDEKNNQKLLSNSSNNDNDKEINKKNLFKVQSFISSITKDDSKKDSLFSSSEDNNKDNTSNSNISNNSNTNINFNYIHNNLPLKERMKLKKEKTKKLLENKTQRTKEEEPKEINNNNKYLYINNQMMSKLSKKEIKMLRNRLSAQRSRDRKKKELLDLKIITKNLLQENEKLRNEIKQRDDKINQLLNILCPQCKQHLEKNKFQISVNMKNNSTNSNIYEIQQQLTPSSIIGSKKKLAMLMTGLFTIFCVFGTLINPAKDNGNILRSLKENNIINKNNNNTCNGEKRVNVPFLIEKDYTIRHQKEIEMYQKIKKNNLKNKNLMVPASLFTNNSEQIISNINNKSNHLNKTDNNNNNQINEDKNNFNDDNNNKINKFLANTKIKIIEREYSNKGNNDIQKEENNIKETKDN